MGLFSGKKKTYASTSFSRMIEDKDIKDTRQVSILSYNLNSDTRVDALADSFTDVYLRNKKNTIATRSISAYRWSDTNYPYGVPKGDLLIKDKIDFITELTDFLLNQKIRAEVQYSKFGPLNNLHFAYKILVDKYKFDIDSNEVVSESQKNMSKTYLQDIKIVYCKESIANNINVDMLNGLGYSGDSGYTPNRHTDRSRKLAPYSVDNDAKHDYVIFTFVRNGEQYSVTEDYLQWEFSGSEESFNTQQVNDHDYFMVRYLNLDTNKTELFTYQYGLGEYLQLDALFVNDADLGMYLPNIYLRLNSEALNKKSMLNTDEFKKSTILGRKLGFNYSNLIDSVHKEVDTEYVTEMFLSYRLPVNTKDPLIAEYVYQYFYELYKSVPNSSAEKSKDKELNKEMRKGFSKGGCAYRIADKRTAINISMQGINYTDSIENIGKVGTVIISRSTVGSKTTSMYRQGVLSPVHQIKKQITDTVVRTINVFGLSSTQSISGGSDSVASGGDENLMIPIDVDLVRKKYRQHENELITKSLYFVINTVQVVKQKWYQTGIFKVIMFVIAVVLAYFSGGQSLIWYMALLKAIAIAIIVNIAVTLVAKLLVNVFHLDAGIVLAILAIIALVVGAYASLGDTAVAGLNATQFMQIASAAFSVSNASYALQMKNKAKAFEEFAHESRLEMEEILEKRKLLGLESGHIDIYDLLAKPITGPDIRIGETPRSFLERTLTVNVGYYPIDVIPAYVYLNTQLPTIQEILAKVKQRGVTA